MYDQCGFQPADVDANHQKVDKVALSITFFPSRAYVRQIAHGTLRRQFGQILLETSNISHQALPLRTDRASRFRVLPPRVEVRPAQSLMTSDSSVATILPLGSEGLSKRLRLCRSQSILFPSSSPKQESDARSEYRLETFTSGLPKIWVSFTSSHPHQVVWTR